MRAIGHLVSDFDPDLIRAIIDKVKAELPGHTWASGTVTRAVSDAGFSSVVELVLDGDQTGTVVQATNLTATPMTGGVRVKVVFDPPQGIYVLGVLSQNAVPVGRLECATGTSSGVVTWTGQRMMDGGMTSDNLRLILPLNAKVAATARIAFSGGGGEASLVAYNSDGGGLSIVDQTFSADSEGRMLLATAACPVMAGGWLQVETGVTISTTTPGTHFAAHYVATYQDLGVINCASG